MKHTIAALKGIIGKRDKRANHRKMLDEALDRYGRILILKCKGLNKGQISEALGCHTSTTSRGLIYLRDRGFLEHADGHINRTLVPTRQGYEMAKRIENGGRIEG